jgi:uncharacterized protein (DUF4415 family)
MMHRAQEYDFSKAKRGAVAPVTTGKTRITIRLDDEVLEWFRTQVYAAGGGNYQSLINLALLEETLRRILREEFRGESARPSRVQNKFKPTCCDCLSAATLGDLSPL